MEEWDGKSKQKYPARFNHQTTVHKIKNKGQIFQVGLQVLLQRYLKILAQHFNHVTVFSLSKIPICFICVGEFKFLCGKHEVLL